MRKIELVDRVSGRSETKELEYKEFETEEIESLKRWFAEKMVGEEWMTQGKLDLSFEKGWVFTDDTHKSKMTFQCQCIKRENEIDFRLKN